MAVDEGNHTSLIQKIPLEREETTVTLELFGLHDSRAKPRLTVMNACVSVS